MRPGTFLFFLKQCSTVSGVRSQTSATRDHYPALHCFPRIRTGGHHHFARTELTTPVTTFP